MTAVTRSGSTYACSYAGAAQRVPTKQVGNHATHEFAYGRTDPNGR